MLAAMAPARLGGQRVETLAKHRMKETCFTRTLQLKVVLCSSNTQD